MCDSRDQALTRITTAQWAERIVRDIKGIAIASRDIRYDIIGLPKVKIIVRSHIQPLNVRCHRNVVCCCRRGHGRRQALTVLSCRWQ